jgi:hypothetical protein
MKNIFYFLSFIFLFSACSSSLPDFAFSSSNFYKLNLSDDSSFFIEYPKFAIVEENAGNGTLLYGDCSINFSAKSSPLYIEFHDLSLEYDVNSKSIASVDYEAWFRSDILSAYLAVLNDFDYAFWVYDEISDVSSCIPLLEFLAEHFTDRPMYVNDKYSFAVELISDYKLDYLADDGGLIMKRWVEEEGVSPYALEIMLTAYPNSMGYLDLSDLLIKKYAGYETEFVQFDSFSGFFVNEGAEPDAIIRFFTMSDDASIVYESYLKVPSIHYGQYKEFFGDFLKTMQFL